MVQCVDILVISLFRKGMLHSFWSPREIVIGNEFRCPDICIGTHIQGLVGGTNDTDQDKLINELYFRQVENGSGHIIFKLEMKAVVLVNRVILILTLEKVIIHINKMGVLENQPEGVQFTDRDGRVSIRNVAVNLNNKDNNNNSNASDEIFDHDKKYKK